MDAADIREIGPTTTRWVVFGAVLAVVAVWLPWISGNVTLGFVDIGGIDTIGGVATLVIALAIGLSHLVVTSTSRARQARWLTLVLGVTLLAVVSLSSLAAQELPLVSVVWNEARPGFGMYVAAIGGLLAIAGATTGPEGLLARRRPDDRTAGAKHVRITGARLGFVVGAAWVAIVLASIVAFDLSLGEWIVPLLMFFVIAGLVGWAAAELAVTSSYRGQPALAFGVLAGVPMVIAFGWAGAAAAGWPGAGVSANTLLILLRELGAFGQPAVFFVLPAAVVWEMLLVFRLSRRN